MKPRCLCVCMSVLVFGLVGAAHGLPQETLLVAEQQSTLLVQCGIPGVFDPIQVYTTPASSQEEPHQVSLPAVDEPHAAPVTAVPEPSTLGLLGLGVVLGLGLVGLRRRATQKP